MANFDDIDLKLCHRCGTCVGVCPTEAITMVDNLPRLTGKCTNCALCYEACPGIEFRYPEFNKRLFGESKVDSEIGYYRSINVGHATDEAIRKKGASGGVVTALLLGLLRRKEIDGAIVVGMNNEYPWVPEVKIATSLEEIIDAAQSKYSMISVNGILNRLGAIKGNLAFVGLPCHIHGVRKLEEIGCEDAERIKYYIGTFCGFNMEPEATDFLIKKLKIKKEEIESLEYRGGDWPGGFLIRTKNGCRYFIEKHFYNYLNLMYVPKRCLVCPDLTNEFADLAVGDAWNKGLNSSSWSTIIIRSEKGQRLIDGAIKAKDIIINANDKGKLKEGHSHLILYKKKGVSIRQRFLGMNPDFKLPAPVVNAKGKLFNILFFYLILFMRTKFVFAIFKYTPITLPGILARYLRTVIHFISRPERKKDGLFHRMKMEYRYLVLKDWSLRDVGAHWDSIEDYDNINKETYSYFRRFIDGYRLSDLPRNSYVLDICARTGNGTHFFWEKGVMGRVVCADFSRRMQSVCGELLKKAGVSFRQELIESIPLPFKEGEFDAIFCFETVEHLPKPEIFIKELGRVVKEGGQLILTTPNRLWRPIHSLAAIFNLHHSEGPCRFISRGRLHNYLCEAGFDIIAERTTVLIPGGPKFLVRLGEWLEWKVASNLMPLLGLRRIFICKKV